MCPTVHALQKKVWFIWSGWTNSLWCLYLNGVYTWTFFGWNKKKCKCFPPAQINTLKGLEKYCSRAFKPAQCCKAGRWIHNKASQSISEHIILFWFHNLCANKNRIRANTFILNQRILIKTVPLINSCTLWLQSSTHRGCLTNHIRAPPTFGLRLQTGMVSTKWNSLLVLRFSSRKHYDIKIIP